MTEYRSTTGCSRADHAGALPCNEERGCLQACTAFLLADVGDLKARNPDETQSYNQNDETDEAVT
jgi:hypothetical protein